MQTLFNNSIQGCPNKFHCSFWFLIFILINLACAPSRFGIKHSFSKKNIAELTQQIESVLSDSALYQSRTGIKAVSLETGQVLFEKDSELLFHPASNMKLLTTATALRKLRPNFRFKTTFFADTSSVTDSTISGNLYIKGFGNPSLTTKDLWGIVQKIKELGIQRITGDLICDETYLDDYYRGANQNNTDPQSSGKRILPKSLRDVIRKLIGIKEFIVIRET